MMLVLSRQGREVTVVKRLSKLASVNFPDIKRLAQLGLLRGFFQLQVESGKYPAQLLGYVVNKPIAIRFIHQHALISLASQPLEFPMWRSISATRFGQFCLN